MDRLHLTFVFVLSILFAASQAREICPAVQKCLRRLKRGNPCPLLPVPKKSLIAPPTDAFVLKTLRPGVYSYSDGAYFTLILYKDRHLALVDFPVSPASIGPNGEYLLFNATLKVLSGAIPKRIDMVYSHRHLDHVGNAGIMKENLDKTFPGVKTKIWGTTETAEFFSRPEMSKLPAPTKIVKESGKTIGIAEGLELRLQIVGGHTVQDLACHVPPSSDGKGVLHYVDIVNPGFVPFLDFALTVDFERYIQAQKDVLELDWEIFSPGHVRIGSKFDIVRNLRYAEFVLKAMTEAPASVSPKDIRNIGRLVGNPDKPQFGNSAWAFIRTQQLAIDICVLRVIRRWGCILAAADLFAPSHCKEAAFFNLVQSQM